MNRNDVQWRGYWAALPTPFDRDGEIDWESFDVVIEKFLDTGVHGLLVNGSSGEWHSQTDVERQATAARAVQVIGNRVPVVIGCSSMSPTTTVDLARHAAEIGADGVMASAPPYLRPADDDVVELFRSIDAAADIPVMVYNIPRRVGIELGIPLLHRLAAVRNVVALKNSATPDEFFPALESLSGDVRIFGPNLLSDRGVDAMANGRGDGFMGGWELLGHTLPDFFQAIWAGDIDRARELGGRERDLDLLMWDEAKRPRFGRSFQSTLKAALTLIGIPAGLPRRPLLPLDDPAMLAELESVLGRFGLLVG